MKEKSFEKNLSHGSEPKKQEHDEKDKEKERQKMEAYLERFEEKAQRIDSMRLNKAHKKREIPPVQLDEKKEADITQEVVDSKQHLDACHAEGFGISPSGNPEDSFYHTMWSRDLAHAGGNFYTREKPQALIDSLGTVFSYQKDDGSLPYRVERKRFLLEHTTKALFGFDLNILKKIGIDPITRKKDRPVYEGQDGGNAEDTIPSIVVTLGELFLSSKEGRQFVANHFEQVQSAMENFMQRTDPQDGLEISKKSNPDWADSLNRGNKKIGTINIWYARALRMMVLITEGLGKSEEAQAYRKKHEKVQKGVLEKLYDKDGHYFRTGEGEDRVDATASVFGCLYMLSAEEGALVQDTMRNRLTTNAGLKNFDPPYPKNKIYPILRLIGMGGYHNECVWPWVTAQNIQAKIKIALEHPQDDVRERFKKEAVEDLAELASLFKEAGGAYEVFDPDTRQAAKLRTGFKKYKVPKNLMGNMAAFHSAHAQLKALGWIES